MTKKFLLVICFLLVLCSCSRQKEIPELLEGNYRSHIVTFDGITPAIDLDNDKLKEILILLHHRIPQEKIKTHFKMNDSVWNERVNYLYGHGLIKKTDDGKYLPTFFILDNDNATVLRKFTDSLGAELSGIAIDRLNKIKEVYGEVVSLKNIPFDNISLFILGSVVHDYWQEKFYQDQFIKSFVPHRGNAYYYYAMVQNENTDENSIIIFETKFYDYSSFQFGSYSYSGNELNLVTFPTSILKNYFGRKETETDSAFQLKLINDLIGISKNPAYKMEAKHLEGFERFGLIAKGKCSVPYITRTDKQKLYNIASVITTDIVSYFENRQTLFVKRYLNSQYREETNYKEWMVWVYKMITTRAVEELIKKSVIKIQYDKTASFIIQK